jgi:hypothetical protein
MKYKQTTCRQKIAIHQQRDFAAVPLLLGLEANENHFGKRPLLT